MTQMFADNEKDESRLAEHAAAGSDCTPLGHLSEERDPETYRIIGCAFSVHSQLGSGFLEAVYQEALAIEFEASGIPFRREAPIRIFYRNRELTSPYRADFLCHDAIIVELKVAKSLDESHQAQVIHYLKATGLQRALLLNFGAPRLEHKRLINSHHLRTSAQSAVEG